MNKLTMLLVATCAANALAMPTKDELKKAQPLVAELMADDIAAFKAKTKKPTEIGEVSVKFASEASTEAAKFLLLKGAISYFIRGEEYDKAADAVNSLKAAVPDLPPSVLEEIIRKDTSRVTAKKAPRLFAQYTMAQTQVAALKTVNATKTAIAKKPNDPALSKRLAEAYALAGDWKSALDAFQKLKDDSAKITKDEAAGKNLAAADFWWGYSSYAGEDDADVFKIHAAQLYRQALAAGEINGLKKNIAEKRVKQFKGELAATPAVATTVKADSNAKAPPAIAKKTTSGKGPWMENGNTATLTLGNGEKLEFVKCPAGGADFRIGCFGPQEFKRVKITRPFWIMTRPLAMRNLKGYLQYKSQWNGKDGDYDYTWGMTHADTESFADTLNDELKEALPKGYVVRNPTLAEWEYAFRANSRDPNDIYQFQNIDNRNTDTAAKLLAENPQGKSPKNKWGIHEFSINEQLLDRFIAGNSEFGFWGDPTGKKQNRDKLATVNKIIWRPEYATDPLVWTDDPEQMPGWRYLRLSKTGRVNVMTDRKGEGHVRLVVGPDLVSEWKARNGKK